MILVLLSGGWLIMRDTRNQRSEFFNGAANPLDNVLKCLVSVLPCCYCSPLFMQAFKMSEKSLLPFTRMQNDRDHEDIALFTTLERTLYLDIVAIVRSNKVRANEEQ